MKDLVLEKDLSKVDKGKKVGLIQEWLSIHMSRQGVMPVEPYSMTLPGPRKI
jgi:hypothetical protein